jgi:hypothetical protein
MDITRAAAKIQRRWRTFSEGEGRMLRMGRRLDGEYFDFLRQGRYDRVDMSEFMTPFKITLFKRWLLRVLIRANEPAAVRKLASLCSTLFCFYVEIFQSKLAGATALVSAATQLVADLLALMEGNLDSVPRIGGELSEFIRLFSEWRATHYLPFIGRLRGDLIYLIYQGLMSTHTVSEVHLSKFRTTLAMYTLMYPGAAELKTSPVYKALVIAQNSKYFTTISEFSNSKVLHEFIIERSLNFQIPIDQTIPFLVEDHSVDGRLVDSVALRNDLMSSMIFFTNNGNVMELVANTFSITENCDTLEFATRIINLLLEMVSNTSTVSAIRSEWDANKEHRPLEVLVHAVRMVRNLSENAFVGLTRPSLQPCVNLETFAPTPAAYHLLQVDKTERTHLWIDSALAKCPREEVEALARGHPFALHGFFNQAVLDLVLDSPDRLADDVLPEFLMRDQERLRAIRFEFALHSFETRHLMEFICSGRWIGARPLPPAFMQMAEKFQRILKLGFWAHGEGVCVAVMHQARMRL